MINLTFQVKKWRCREVKSLVQGHTMNKCQSQDLSFNLTLKHCSFPSIALEVLSQASKGPQPLKSDAQLCLCAFFLWRVYILYGPR